MALITQSADYGYSILPHFNVDPELAGKSKTLGVVIEQPSAGHFVVKYAGSVAGTQTIKGPAISLAKTKQLGPASLNAIKFKFEQDLKAALTMALKATNQSEHEVVAAPLKSSSVLKNPLKTSLKKAPPELVEEDDSYDPYETKKASGSFLNDPFGKPLATNGSAVQLAKATALYQPVKGTTAGTNYYVLALYQGINLAVRIKTNGSGFKYSIRAEGDNFSPFVMAMVDMGMDKGMSTNGYTYFSGHFEIANMGDLMKTIGATLGRFGFSAAKQMADPTKLIKACLP